MLWLCSDVPRGSARSLSIAHPSRGQLAPAEPLPYIPDGSPAVLPAQGANLASATLKIWFLNSFSPSVDSKPGSSQAASLPTGTITTRAPPRQQGRRGTQGAPDRPQRPGSVLEAAERPHCPVHRRKVAGSFLLSSSRPPLRRLGPRGPPCPPPSPSAVSKARGLSLKD